ncbi:MAG: HDOD domain-containing protein [Kofleriaceae bacterium]
MLRDAIDALGGPMVELDREVWSTLAKQVDQLAASAPPPPSFPMVAMQVLSLAKKPELDLNELVGIVQRDAAIATAMLRIANSAMFAPAVPITTVRAAISSLGLRNVVEIVLGTAGKSFYTVASTSELDLYPALWQSMFDEAMANAFTCGRLALDIRGARGERALLAGLLSDVGRPIALRILSRMIRDGVTTGPLDEATVLATLDEVAPAVGRRAIMQMNLPEELRVACIADAHLPTADSQIAQLVSAIGAIQRRSPRIWISAGDVRVAAERLGLEPLVVRTQFAQRHQYVIQATEMFGGTVQRAA